MDNKSVITMFIETLRVRDMYKILRKKDHRKLCGNDGQSGLVYK